MRGVVRQLDPSLDGLFKLVDIQYLLLVVAGKYRFVSDLTSACGLLGPEPTDVQDMNFTVKVYTEAGMPSSAQKTPQGQCTAMLHLRAHWIPQHLEAASQREAL